MTFRPLTGRPPRHPLPQGATDCHIHIFDGSRYSGQPGGPPPPPDALISHYEQVMGWLGIDRVVITQGNAYQFDNRYLLEGLDHFGDRARGIVAIEPETSDAAIAAMSARGVRGARIMDLLQGAVGLDRMLEVNARVHPFGWSMIVQFDGRRILDHLDRLKAIKGDWVLDHMGKFLEPVAPDSAEFRAVLDLVDRGNCYVKLAACYETSRRGPPDYDDVGALARTVIAHAPERVIWGSNWPHNMARSIDTYPDDVTLLDLAWDWAGSDANRQRIFVENPARLYGF